MAAGRNSAVFGTEEIDRPLEGPCPERFDCSLTARLGDDMAEQFTIDDRHGRATSTATRPQGAGRQASYNQWVSRYVRRPLAIVTPLVVAAAVAATISIGWLQSDEGHLTPKTGIGYWLGIIGSSAMLLLLVYPMRKRMPGLRFLGSVPLWFRLHMMLGIVGPMLVVFHTNFKLGALNSNVAFISMLIVAFSGVIGRYFYGKIHLGLHGRKAAVQEILDDAARMQQALGSSLSSGSRIIAQMDAFAVAAMTPQTSLLRSLSAMIGIALRATTTKRRLRRQLHGAIATEATAQGWTRKQRRTQEAKAKELVALYFAAMSRAAKFGFYERLFALWHVLHLPLFILLIAAALVHVLAVHLY